MKKIYLYLFFITISHSSFSQYNLTENELTNGFYYLRDNAGFKNPSSVKYNSHTQSTKKFEKECFTWAKYDISAQNSFGGYGRDNYIVYFYEGKPMHIESSSGVYYMFPNNDKVADQVIEWATAMGKFPGECAVEKEKKQKEEAEKKRLEQERIILENQKKDSDKVTISKINALLDKKVFIEAANEFSKLNYENPELKKQIQKILDKEYANEIVDLSNSEISDYINFQMRVNKANFLAIEYGKYEIKFDSFGNSSNENFPPLWVAFSPVQIPIKNVGPFSVNLSSRGKINIELKDSILVSTVYNKSNTKPLFVDKNENFYFKSKNGLPVAQFLINPAIDKNSVVILKQYKREKYANEILIGTEGFYFEKTVEIKKKDY